MRRTSATRRAAERRLSSRDCGGLSLQSAAGGRLSASFYEDLQRQAGGSHARVVPRRRRGEDARPARDADRRHAPRQAEAAVHAARRHRRLRRRRERREDPGDRQQARSEALLPPLGLSRRVAQPDAPRAARAPADGGAPRRREGDAPQEPARAPADHEAQDLRRPRAPARGPESPPAGVGTVIEIAQYRGTGKRKTSVARVILRPGDGSTWVNGRTLEEYFPRSVWQTIAVSPLKVAGLEGQYDLRVRVHGGGLTGQAGAVRHGIARALVEANQELRVPLKREGFLTRDARQVERKKAGLHKARKAPQFSKR